MFFLIGLLQDYVFIYLIIKIIIRCVDVYDAYEFIDLTYEKI